MLFPDHNSSFRSWISILFCTILSINSRVCHDLDLRLYLQGQGQSAYLPKIHVQATTVKLDLDNIFNTLLSITQGLCRDLDRRLYLKSQQNKYPHNNNPCVMDNWFEVSSLSKLPVIGYGPEKQNLAM